MNEKKWHASKTIWLNVLVIGAGLLTELAGLLDAGVSVGIVAVLNILLRLITNKGLTK